MLVPEAATYFVAQINEMRWVSALLGLHEHITISETVYAWRVAKRPTSAGRGDSSTKSALLQAGSRSAKDNLHLERVWFSGRMRASQA